MTSECERCNPEKPSEDEWGREVVEETTSDDKEAWQSSRCNVVSGVEGAGMVFWTQLESRS